MRGRKPSSAEEKRVTGDPGGHGGGKVAGEIKPKGSVIKPKFLRGRASEVWDEHAENLIRIGTLTTMSVPQFALYCVLVAQMEKAPAKFNGSKTKDMLRLAEDFRMNGTPRPVPGGAAPGKPADPAEGYFQS